MRLTHIIKPGLQALLSLLNFVISLVSLSFRNIEMPGNSKHRLRLANSKRCLLRLLCFMVVCLDSKFLCIYRCGRIVQYIQFQYPISAQVPCNSGNQSRYLHCISKWNNLTILFPKSRLFIGAHCRTAPKSTEERDGKFWLSRLTESLNQTDINRALFSADHHFWFVSALRSVGCSVSPLRQDFSSAPNDSGHTPAQMFSTGASLATGRSHENQHTPCNSTASPSASYLRHPISSSVSLGHPPSNRFRPFHTF